MKAIKKFLPFVALLFVVVAFVLSFFAALQIIQGGLHAEFRSIIWGSREIKIENTVVSMKETFGYDNSGIAPLPFVGLILTILGAAGAIVVLFLTKKPFAKWIVLACGVVVLAGAIMVFFAPSAFARNMAIKQCEVAGITDKDLIQKAIKDAIEDMHNSSPKAPIPVIIGVLGCLAGVATAVSAFLPEKK